jgi:NTE family protein
MRTNRQPKISLVLSGGAGRGNAHIGVLKVLVREGIPIDYLAGASMGGVFAAGYAAGLSPQALEEEALRMSSWSSLLELVDRKLPQNGIFTGERFEKYLASQIGPDLMFDDLRIPLRVTAVDLIEGQEVVLGQGRVVDAVRATVAVPGLIAAQELNGRKLVDGGVLNNLPVDVGRQMGGDIVIAVNVMAGFSGMIPSWLGKFTADTQRSLAIMFRRLHELKMEQWPPDVLIDLSDSLPAGVISGYTRAAEIIAFGEAAAEAALPQIQQAIADWQPAARLPNTYYTMPDPARAPLSI